MSDRIQLRRDIAANWAAVNPVLSLGEIGIELDNNRCKRGNGINVWSALPWFTDGLFTAAEKTKLAGIAAGADVNTVVSVDGQTGTVTITGKLPSGGSVNQVLAKTSGSDYATAWVTPTATSSGNVDGGSP